MTAPHIADPASLLGEALPEASPGLMRHLLQTMLNALLSADADAVMVAEWGQPSPTRTTHRNSYHHRDLDTRLSPPSTSLCRSCAQSPTSPDWLMERRKRAESALITIVADCYLAGVVHGPHGSPPRVTRGSPRVVPPSW